MATISNYNTFLVFEMCKLERCKMFVQKHAEIGLEINKLEISILFKKSTNVTRN